MVLVVIWGDACETCLEACGHIAPASIAAVPNHFKFARPLLNGFGNELLTKRTGSVPLLAKRTYPVTGYRIAADGENVTAGSRATAAAAAAPCEDGKCVGLMDVGGYLEPLHRRLLGTVSVGFMWLISAAPRLEYVTRTLHRFVDELDSGTWKQRD